MIAGTRGLTALGAIAALAVGAVVVDMTRGHGSAVVSTRLPVPTTPTTLRWHDGATNVTVTHGATGWTRTAPDAGDTDGAAIDDLVHVLAAVHWHQRGSAEDAAPVQGGVTIDGVDVGVGRSVEGTELAWLVVDGRGYTVDRWIAKLIGTAAERARHAPAAKPPVAEPSVDLVPLRDLPRELRWDEQHSLTFAGHDITWHDGDAQAPANERARRGVLDLAATGAVVEVPRDAPSLTLTVTASDGSVHRLARYPHDIVRRDDEALALQLAAGSTEWMLDWSALRGAAPWSLDATLVSGVAIMAKGTTRRFTRGEVLGEWKTEQGEAAPAEVAQVVQAVAEMTIDPVRSARPRGTPIAVTLTLDPDPVRASGATKVTVELWRTAGPGCVAMVGTATATIGGRACEIAASIR